ncbi:MAG: IS1634 family transposase, partial [Gammaproteobacteria bacterium]
MAEIAGEELKILSIDHHGLIAAVCKDLKIAEKINEKLVVNKQRVINPGQAVVAMILNGLGFTNRILYLTHQFFQNKPVDRLLENDSITSKDLTDYTLSHTLDEIHQYGTSKLFGEIAFSIAIEHKLLGNLNYLDTTSLSVVKGDYKNNELNGNDVEPKTIHITYGHSKDHRSDLKQAVLSLVVNGPSATPIWMDALDGNSSEKKSFHETIKKVQEFKKQINLEKDFKWIE